MAAIAIVAVSVVLYNQHGERVAAEEATEQARLEQRKREDHYSSLHDAQIKMLGGAAAAEDLGNLVIGVWHSAIFDGEDQAKWSDEAKPYLSDDFNSSYRDKVEESADI